MSLVRVGSKNQVVIPKDVRVQLGVGPGDYVEIAFENKRASIRPKKIVDRDEPIGPKTKAAIRQGLKDIKEGKILGPFNSVTDMIADLHKRASTKPKG